MPLSRELSQLASVITVKDSSRDVGINSSTPTAKLDVGGNVNISGVITATSFSGDGSNLDGVGVGTQTSINTSGIITATSFVGSGTNLTGITTLQYDNSSISIATTDGSLIFKSNDVIVASISSETASFNIPLNLNDNNITNLAAPSSLSDATSKDYVDNQVSGEFPAGDYGDLSSGDTDAFGQIITNFSAFDCLTSPSGSLATTDLGVLT